jgi:hypothetical protein
MKNNFLAFFFFFSLFFQSIGYCQVCEKIISSDSANIVPISTQSQEMKNLKFNLGDIIVSSRDEELHYIKIELGIEYEGLNEEPFLKHADRIQEKVTQYLMQLTVQRAKEDYINAVMHKDIQKFVEKIIEEIAPGSIKIKKILIPTFLVN